MPSHTPSTKKNWVKALMVFGALVLILILGGIGGAIYQHFSSSPVNMPITLGHWALVTIQWIAEQTAKLFPWPFLILVAFFLSSVRNGASRLIDAVVEFANRVDKFEGMGVSIQANPERAREIATDVIEVNYNKTISSLVAKLKIEDKLKAVTDEVIRPRLVDGAQNNNQFRVCIHIPDGIYKDALYQLTNYYPAPADTGKGPGRRNSIRFGIIGRAYRRGESIYNPDVTDSVKGLIDQWGMKKEEAETVLAGRKTFLVVMLKDQEAQEYPDGLLFMDAAPTGALGDETQGDAITQAVVDAASKHGLTAALDQLHSAYALVAKNDSEKKIEASRIR